jgi:NAD(P)-dependent dehydrogenase (short-subunit alcohol dehydrogenase family)
LRGGTWIATGGARGITASAARELARRHGWRVHLLGLSPAPRADAAWRNYSEAEMKALKTRLAREAVAEGRSPSEAWDRVMKDVEIYNNLRQFADAGVEATYHACDISDRAALARTLDEIRRQDGPIHGILHGAGMIDPGRFEHKRPAFVEKLVRAKYDGLMNLVALTWNDPLAYCVGFGSISGRFGGNGLSDYAAGNDAMAKLLDWLRAARPDCAAACVHWESWEGSGMATLPRFAWGPKSVMNMKYMMPEEGVRRLEQELQAGLPDGEVLYTFGDFYPMFYPAEQRPLGAFTPGPLDGGANEKNDEHDAEPRRPLLAAVRATETGRVGDVPLDPRSDAFLIQHRLRDKPLLPVVVGLEALAEIAIGDDSRGATPPRTRHPQIVDLRLDDVNAKSGHHVVGFENIQMLDGMLFHTDAAVTAQAEAKFVGGDRADCSLTCDFRNRAGKLIQKDRPYLRASVVLSDRPTGRSTT